MKERKSLLVKKRRMGENVAVSQSKEFWF